MAADDTQAPPRPTRAIRCTGPTSPRKSSRSDELATWSFGVWGAFLAHRGALVACHQPAQAVTSGSAAGRASFLLPRRCTSEAGVDRAPMAARSSPEAGASRRRGAHLLLP